MVMKRYGIDRVEGDTPTTASELKPGDQIRTYSGLADKITVTRNERQIGMGARYTHSLSFSDGTRNDYTPAEQRYDRATGPDRDELGRFA